MTAPTVADYLKFANLQMAAEALYDFKAPSDAATLVPGAKRIGVPLTEANLITALKRH